MSDTTPAPLPADFPDPPHVAVRGRHTVAVVDAAKAVDLDRWRTFHSDNPGWTLLFWERSEDGWEDPEDTRGLEDDEFFGEPFDADDADADDADADDAGDVDAAWESFSVDPATLDGDDDAAPDVVDDLDEIWCGLSSGHMWKQGLAVLVDCPSYDVPAALPWWGCANAGTPADLSVILRDLHDRWGTELLGLSTEEDAAFVLRIPVDTVEDIPADLSRRLAALGDEASVAEDPEWGVLARIWFD